VDGLQTFREWFAARIKERDWGVAEAGREIGISHAQVSRYLAGHSVPERKAIKALSRTFEISRDELEALVDAGRPISPSRDPLHYSNAQAGATLDDADAARGGILQLAAINTLGAGVWSQLSPDAQSTILRLVEREVAEGRLKAD
jgi:transcriptional regulator with XRE-family HTH domain